MLIIFCRSFHRFAVVLYICVPCGDCGYSLLLWDPLHRPEGLRVAHVAGQGLHQRVFDVCRGQKQTEEDPFYIFAIVSSLLEYLDETNI